MTRTPTVVAAAVLLLAACGPREPAPSPAVERPDAPVSAALPATPAEPASEALTARGYGPLRIGMGRAEVVAALGEDASPNASGGAEPEVCDQWRPARAPEGLLVMIQNGVLTRISVARTTTLKTDRGLGVGDTAASVKTAYGPELVTQPHKYAAPPAEDLFAWQAGGPATGGAYVQDEAARGIRYEIGNDGKVSMVHIGGPAIQLVEGCA